MMATTGADVPGVVTGDAQWQFPTQEQGQTGPSDGD
jgi:hypothetical protein